MKPMKQRERNSKTSMSFKEFNICKAVFWPGLILLILSLVGAACVSTDNSRLETVSLTEDAPVTLTAEVDRAEATVIDPFTMSITLEADPQISISLPDIGPIFLKALLNQDIYLSGTILMIYSSLTIIGTFISDVLLAMLDPRIRMGGGAA